MTMNADLAQTVALAAHGDAWLRVGGPAPELFPDHSAFRHVRRLAFVRSEPPVFSQRRDRDPATAPWYQDLRDRGASALQMATWRQ